MYGSLSQYLSIFNRLIFFDEVSNSFMSTLLSSAMLDCYFKWWHLIFPNFEQKNETSVSFERLVQSQMQLFEQKLKIFSLK